MIDDVALTQPTAHIQAAPSISWGAPDPIVYGTALGSGQLDASGNVPGTFSYSPAAGTILGAGSHTLSVTFTPSDTLDYTTATATTTITVTPAAPSIAWGAPDPIVYGTALGSGQLDASGNVPGTFSYTPAAGTILGAGSHTLSVTFTPSDTLDYTTATATTTITVEQATPKVGVSDAGFESPSQGSGTYSYTYDPSSGPWSYSGPAGVAGNGSGFTTATPMPRRGPRSPSCRTRARSARSWPAWPPAPTS